ncbi:MAG: YdcF family protein [Methylocystaceae bacterium]|nr:YdcF family protein [Methylocystaceae bacterium]
MDDLGNPSPALLRRLQTACLLAYEKQADLLMCGGTTQPDLGASEAEVMAAFAINCGVASEQIFLENRSQNTLENAAFSHRIIQQQGWQEVMVVTQNYHIARAKLSFKSCGIQASFYSAAGKTDRVMTFFSALREVPALIWYALRVLNGHPKQLLTRN